MQKCEGFEGRGDQKQKDEVSVISINGNFNILS